MYCIFTPTYNLIIALLYISFVIAENKAFDPTKIDYCQLNCTIEGKTFKHSACGCKIRKGREEILDDIVNFRKDVLNLHNKLRNYVASGLEKNPNAGKATNMRAINYDLELEYIARCMAGRITEPPDKCRRPNGYAYSGQNFAGYTEKTVEIKSATKQIQKWYDEIKYINESVIDNFPGSNDQFDYSHFTQLIWSSQEYVGCARIAYKKNPHEDFRWALICNYGSPSGPTNEPGEPVYVKGDLCSDCNTTCHVELTGLCGKIRPAPTDAPPTIPNSFAGLITFYRNRLLYVSCVILLVFH